jgi:hypothetical protein
MLKRDEREKEKKWKRERDAKRIYFSNSKSHLLLVPSEKTSTTIFK